MRFHEPGRITGKLIQTCYTACVTQTVSRSRIRKISSGLAHLPIRVKDRTIARYLLKQACWQGSRTTSYLCSVSQIYYSLFLHLTFKSSFWALTISISVWMIFLRSCFLWTLSELGWCEWFVTNSYNEISFWLFDSFQQIQKIVNFGCFLMDIITILSSTGYTSPLYYNDGDYFHQFQSCNGSN